MPDQVEHYLVELVRHLRGRMPKEKIDDVVNETHGHLLEMGAVDRKGIKRAFGSPGRYARSLLLAQAVDNVSTWREGRWVFVVIALAFPAFYLLVNGVVPSRYYIFVPLTILLAVWLVSMRTRKSVVLPIISASLASLILFSLILGVSYTRPVTKDPRAGVFHNRIARFSDRSPTERAIELNESLQADEERIDSIFQQLQSGRLEESTLRYGTGYWTGQLQANLPFPEYRRVTLHEFDEAVYQWENSEVKIRESAATALVESDALVNTKWNSILDETIFALGVSYSFYTYPLMASLTGNLMGWFLNSFVLWPRRRGNA